MNTLHEPATASGVADELGSPGGAALPERLRVLHVVVPAHVFNHAKAQAALSGLSFKEYMKRFLEEAFPYGGSDQPKGGTT